MTLLTALGLAGCSSGGSDAAPQVVALALSSSTPADGAENVPPSTLVRLELSAPIVTGTVDASTVHVRVNGAPVAFDVAAVDRTIEIALGGALPGSGLVQVEVTDGVRGRAGEQLPGPLNVSFRLESDETDVDPGAGAGPAARFRAGHARLSPTAWLITGGLGGDDEVIGTAEILDGLFVEATGPLQLPRWAHGAGTLADGRVLVCGGFADASGSTATNECEIYDPELRTFTPAGILVDGRAGFELVRTSSGLLVAVGGVAARGGAPASALIEAWDVFSNTFVALDESLPLALADCAAVALTDGRILVAGGRDGTGAVTNRAFVVDPVEGEVVEVDGGMDDARAGAAAVLLPTGGVLIAGGEDSGGTHASLEIFDPAAGTFRTLDDELSAARRDAGAVVLANGAVAIVGGVLDVAGTTSDRVEIFDASTDRIQSVFVLSRGRAGAGLFPLANGGLAIADGAIEATHPPVTVRALTRLSPAALGSDIAAPRIVSVSPRPNAGAVAADAAIEVLFSKPVARASLDGAIVVTDAEGRTVSGAVSLVDGDTRAVFRPDFPLPVRHRIDVVVGTQVTDRLGAGIANDGTRKWSFTTAYDVTIGARDDKSQFGFATAAGDVNGDGVDDILVSAYVAESQPGSGVREGEIYVLFGQGTGAVLPPALRDLSTLAGQADLRITGETSLDQLGQEASLGVADIDDDGYGDIVIGAHFGDGPAEQKSNRGEVWVVFGQPSFPARSLQLGGAVDGFTILRIFGSAAGEKLGEGLAFGDVDDDGYDDIVVGATGVDGDGDRDTGALYLIFGGTKEQLGVATGFGTDTVGPDAATLQHVEFLGADVSDRLGWAAACGDIDGDGFDDVAGGATGGDGLDDQNSSAGDTFVFFGASRATLLPSGNHASYRAGPGIGIDACVVHGEDRVDFYGWSVALGDLDGDGRADLAIGGRSADGAANGRSNAGEVAILFGAPRSDWIPSGSWGAIAISSSLSTPPMIRVFGEDAKDNCGDAVRFGDVDGDGSLDLLLGATGGGGPSNNMGTNTGELAVVRGLTKPAGGAFEFSLSRTNLPLGVTLTRFYGRQVTDRFGTSIATGDFNGDGRLDLLAGANKATGLGRLFVDSGEAYVLWGRSTWWK